MKLKVESKKVEKTNGKTLVISEHKDAKLVFKSVTMNYALSALDEIKKLVATNKQVFSKYFELLTDFEEFNTQVKNEIRGLQLKKSVTFENGYKAIVSPVKRYDPTKMMEDFPELIVNNPEIIKELDTKTVDTLVARGVIKDSIEYLSTTNHETRVHSPKPPTSVDE